MKTIRLITITLSFLLFNASSCILEKGEDILPPITQKGSNTFGCLIDGKVFTRKDGNMRYTTYANKYNLSVGATQLHSTSCGFGIYNIEIKEKTEYLFSVDVDSISSGGVYKRNTEGLYCDYSTNSNYTGSVYISRFDTINRIVSGTFSFKAQLKNVKFVPENCNCDSTVIVNVTEGRFDLIYSKY